MRLVSVDIGNGYTKAKSSTKEVLFPSVGALEQGALRFDGIIGDNALIIEHNGQRWAIGEDAYIVGRMQVVEMGRARIEDANYLRLYLTAIGQVVSQADELSIIASLPVAWYTGDSEAARRRLSGEFQFTLQGRERHYYIDPARCHIVPEGFGALCQVVLGQAGQIVNSEIGRRKIGVVDIGTRTTDLLFFEDMKFYPVLSEGLENVGIGTLWTLVGEIINQRWGRSLSVYEIDQAIHTRAFQDGASDRDIADIVDNAVSVLAESITAKIKSLWDSGRACQHIIITGGAAALVGYCLPFEHKTILPGGWFANCDGAYRFGLLRRFDNGAR
jgi:plasmid segregation protein ParM